MVVGRCCRVPGGRLVLECSWRDHGGVGLLEMEGWHTARGGGLLVMAGGLLDVVGCWRVAGGLLAMADVR